MKMFHLRLRKSVLNESPVIAFCNGGVFLKYVCWDCENLASFSVSVGSIKCKAEKYTN